MLKMLENDKKIKKVEKRENIRIRLKNVKKCQKIWNCYGQTDGPTYQRTLRQSKVLSCMHTAKNGNLPIWNCWINRTYK